MKELATLLLGVLLTLSATAQQKKQVAPPPATVAVPGPVTKTGRPDKRYKANKQLKKDGTPDRRFKANKSAPGA